MSSDQSHQAEPISPRCLNCQYDVRGLQTDANCPECGRPVWPNVVEISRIYARRYARIETSFYAACLAVVMSVACGPFGILLAVWAVTQSTIAVRTRNQGVVNFGSRNMPFISLGVSILAAIASGIALLTWVGYWIL